jgi:hypothetical protein
VAPGWIVLVTTLGLLVGFAGGWLGSWVRSSRRASTPAPAERPRFELEHVDGQTWSLRNAGAGVARLVGIAPLVDGLEHQEPSPPPHPELVLTEVLPTLGPGAAVGFWNSRYERGQRVAIAWTSEADVRMGPVVLEVPGPR